MAELNKWLGIGRLTRDPEVKELSNGPVANFGLAVNRTWKSKDGEKQEEVLFVDIAVFGNQANSVGQYLSKGREVCIEGRLKLEQWENDAGEKRSKISVVADRVQFLGGNQEEGAPATAGASSNSSGGEGDDDDLPF